MSTLTPEPDPNDFPPVPSLWDTPVYPDEEPVDEFLVRQLLRARYPDFDAEVECFVLVALWGNEKTGESGVAMVPSRTSRWVTDRGLLETALDEYRNLGAAVQLRDEE